MEELFKDHDVSGFKEAIIAGQERLRRCLRLSAVALGALIATSSSVVVLSEGFPLHAYWIPFGQIFLLLWLGSVLFALYECLLCWGAWTILRETKRDAAELLEDRYGLRQDAAHRFLKTEKEPR